MRIESSLPSNVVRFRPGKAAASPARDQRGFMDLVYSAGSIAVGAEDRETKVMAARLQVFGFVAVEEIETDGTARRLRPSEAIHATLARPWRVSKPSWDANRGVSAPKRTGTRTS